MTTKTLLKKLALSKQDFEEIRDAVQQQESRTSGEIAIAVAAESSSYAFWELLSAVVSFFLLMVCMLPFASFIYGVLGSIFWSVESWYMVAFYLAIGIIVVALLYFVYNIPFVDRLIVPLPARRYAVSCRAMRFFAESGVYKTHNRSGVLVFVSYFEQEVRIVADEGISSKISQDLWNLIADELAESISCGNAKDAFINAIKRCGDLLAENYPQEGENRNELANGLIVLEGEKWL